MARKIPFTPASLDDMIHARIFDPETRGLSLELLPSGKKRWRFRRKIAGKKVIVTIFGGLYPTFAIAWAREWARGLSAQTEAGIDPRETARDEDARNSMTVAKAHGLYMVAVREGRSSRAKRPNKPRTISDKLEIYDRDIAPKLAARLIYDVTETELIKLVEAKGKTAKVRANRLAAELKVFFGWASSLRGLEVGLETDPSRRLGDLRFPETARTRKLNLSEIELYLLALVDEPIDFRRGMLLWLLTAARIAEVGRARSDELVGDVWTIPPARAKNSIAHSIALGPWGRSLMLSNHEWVFPAETIVGPRNRSVWYKARDRVLARMSALAGYTIDRFTPHDLRRTARSNTKRLKVDFETAEAMLNHVKKGMERTYDLYEMEDEKRAWFLKWEEEIAGIAKRLGIADALGVPKRPVRILRPDNTDPAASPHGTRIQPRIHFGSFEPRATALLAAPVPQLVFMRESRRAALPEPVDLPTGQSG
jgi:integrase